MKNIDYKELLEKYMRHIASEESWTFTDYLPDTFSEEEKSTLRNLSDSLHGQV